MLPRILLIHNRYQKMGGEDSVFQAETELLERYGHTVEQLIFDNNGIQNGLDKLQAGVASFYNPVSAQRIRKRIAEFQPQIIHVHNIFPLVSPSVFYTARQIKIPVLQTLHNYRMLCANALFFRNGQICEDCFGNPLGISGVLHGCYHDSRLQTACLAGMSALHHQVGTWRNQVSHFITLTEFARSKFLDSHLNIAPERISVKPNFAFDSDAANKKSDYFLYLGRLSKEKGIEPFLQMAAQLSLPIKIIGCGPFESQVLKVTDSHPHVEFLGYQEKTVAIEYLKNARAIVFPSICYEGFPMTIVEALAAGTPIIASRLGGVPEIISHGQNGLLFESGSITQMSDALKLLQNNDELHQDMCTNARQTYLERYTPEKNYNSLMTIYRKTMESQHGKETHTAI